MTERIKFIIRGDAGEYETDQGEDADALYELISDITDARIILLCKTPDGVEQVLSDTRDERYILQHSCDECGFENICIQQSNESANAVTTLESLEYVKQLLDNARAELWKIRDNTDINDETDRKVRTIIGEIGSTENYLTKEVLQPMWDEREGKK